MKILKSTNRIQIKNILLNYIKHKLFFSSTQSKVFAFFALISIILHYTKTRNVKILLAKIIAYFIIIRHLECLVYGNCGLSAWLTILLPILLIIIYILDSTKHFEKIKSKIIKLYAKLNVIDIINKLEVYTFILLIVAILLFFLFI